MTLDDFKYRHQIKDRFIANIFEAKIQVIVDKHKLLSIKD